MHFGPSSPNYRRAPTIILMAAMLPSAVFGQQHQQIIQLVEAHSEHFSVVSQTIWGYAELGYHEEKSSALLRRELETTGFRVQAPVADEPNWFVAETM